MTPGTMKTAPEYRLVRSMMLLFLSVPLGKSEVSVSSMSGQVWSTKATKKECVLIKYDVVQGGSLSKSAFTISSSSSLQNQDVFHSG